MPDDNGVEIHFGASTDEALAAISQIRDALSGLSEPVRRVGGTLDGLNDAFGTALAPDKVTQCAGAFGELGSKAQLAATQVRAIGGEIKVLQQGLAEKKILLDAEVSQYQITQNQKFSILEAATQKEFDAQLVLLQNGLMIDNMTVQ